MSFEHTIPGIPSGHIRLRVEKAAPKPKRADWRRDLRAAEGIIYATVLGAGIWAWLYVAYLFLR